MTPIEQRGNVWLKRDDLFEVAGVRGGKARSASVIARGAQGLVTAGSRHSPQVVIVSAIAKAAGVPCAVFVPSGANTKETLAAAVNGAEVVPVKPGHNSVICARARERAESTGWVLVPFGMECREAVAQTAGQVAEPPDGVKRIVAPVGSGMSLAGILTGLRARGLSLPVLGIVVGARPEKRLDKWAPRGWRSMCELVDAGVPYEQRVDAAVGGVALDPVYEAKCVPFLRDGDLLWIVGSR